jgi:hypothetical protein
MEPKARRSPSIIINIKTVLEREFNIRVTRFDLKRFSITLAISREQKSTNQANKIETTNIPTAHAVSKSREPVINCGCIIHLPDIAQISIAED